MQPDLPEILAHFQLDGRLLEVTPYGTGHINDTFASRFQVGAGIARYIHQRINQNVFREPDKVMENVERVTRYARERIIASGGDPQRETLNLVMARDGQSFHRTTQGDTWRTYLFIDGVRTYDKVEDIQHVHAAARAFGKFQRLLSGLPGERLHETIPHFHHTRRRLDAFLAAVETDAAHRAALVQAEIDFILHRQADASVVVDMLAQGALPERVTHNDTKLNNVLIDERTGEGICVVDLDTVMPGSALYDFGDLVRTGAVTALEDEPDLAKVQLDLDLFERLARGFLDATRDTLTPTEIDHLPFGAKLITFEQAIRFLGDHLDGDVYYRIHRPDHNLDRARTQIKLVAEIERNMDHMQAIIDKYR